MNNTLRKERSSQRLNKKSSPQPQNKDHGKKTTEVVVRIMINGLLSVAALSALFRLVPHHFSQEAKLQEIREEVDTTEERVNRLRENFSDSFGTSQSESVRQNYSPKMEPNQVRVFWQSSTKTPNQN